MILPKLLTRDDFRAQVFARIPGTCAVPLCIDGAKDAHHILERRLFPDGGYYLDNGAALCERHHLMAESTELSAQELREMCGITSTVLPPHLYPDTDYDKWGNPVLPNGRRLKGELFDDASVQKILQPVLHLFDDRVKYPRTWHLPWSPCVGPDDRVLDPDTVDAWRGTDIIVTEKMDGENTTMYRDYIHARSVDFNSHVTRNWIRNFHAKIAHDIPNGMRICGENLSYKHSIGYKALPSFFQVFSIWQNTTCLSWDETVEWCELLGLTMVPRWYRGPYERCLFPFYDAPTHNVSQEVEGYVVRPAEAFSLRDFTTKVGKYVRKNHVTSHGHWLRSRFEPNTLRGSIQ